MSLSPKNGLGFSRISPASRWRRTLIWSLPPMLVRIAVMSGSAKAAWTSSARSRGWSRACGWWGTHGAHPERSSSRRRPSSNGAGNCRRQPGAGGEDRDPVAGARLGGVPHLVGVRHPPTLASDGYRCPHDRGLHHPPSSGDESGGVSEAVAAAVRVVRDSGLPYETNAMFTNIEGEWDEVMDVVKRAVEAVRRCRRGSRGAEGGHPRRVRRPARRKVERLEPRSRTNAETRPAPGRRARRPNPAQVQRPIGGRSGAAGIGARGADPPGAGVLPRRRSPRRRRPPRW